MTRTALINLDTFEGSNEIETGKLDLPIGILSVTNDKHMNIERIVVNRIDNAVFTHANPP